MEQIEETIGSRLRKARNRKKLSIPKVNEVTGISRGNLSGQENDKSKPSADALIALSQLYGVTTDWILKGGNQNPSLIRETTEIYDAESSLRVPNKEMRDFLTSIVETWERGDEHTKGWVIVQLRNAFPEITKELKGTSLPGQSK